MSFIRKKWSDIASTAAVGKRYYECISWWQEQQRGGGGSWQKGTGFISPIVKGKSPWLNGWSVYVAVKCACVCVYSCSVCVCVCVSIQSIWFMIFVVVLEKCIRNRTDLLQSWADDTFDGISMYYVMEGACMYTWVCSVCNCVSK